MIRSLILLLCSCAALSLNLASTACAETKADRDAGCNGGASAVGMFIHWGLYAIPAGEWHGKEVSRHRRMDYAIRQHPVPEYEQLAAKFNPAEFDPVAWVRGRKAGMKYLVITSKHHDGFCLWDMLTDWDVVDATPYGSDL